MIKKTIFILLGSLVILIALLFSLPSILKGIGIIEYFPATFHQKEASLFIDTILIRIKENDTNWIKANSKREFANPIPFWEYDSLKTRLLNSGIIKKELNGFSRQPRNNLVTIFSEIEFTKSNHNENWNKYSLALAYDKKRWWIYVGRIKNWN
jgi:hypothetical protein